MVRFPAVAGRFYPGDVESLLRFLGSIPRPAERAEGAVGVMAPHAGYVYSGKAAGLTIFSVEVPDVVLLLGPNHTGRGTGASIMSRGAWRTPLGDVPVDPALADALKAASPLLMEDASAHEYEHSLEVMLPFLQFANRSVSIVPVAFMLRRAEAVAEVGRAIGGVLRDFPKRVLMVASSDMSHYEEASRAREKDMAALDRVAALDPAGLLEVVARKGITMCGVVPAAVMLYAARELGATSAKVAVYTNSGEASGDFSSVVGYAGVVVAKGT